MNKQFNEMRELFGEVIYSYSRAQAIQDGVLVDLSANFPNESKLYKYNVACTSAVWELIDKGATNPRHHNTHSGIIWDVLYMSIKGITKRFSDSEHLFVVAIAGAGQHRNHVLKAICCPGDDLAPVITILTEFED